MEIAVWIVVLILLFHWLADFVWQPHWMGMRKSKENWVLVQHGLRILAGGVFAAALIRLLSDADLSEVGLLVWALLNAVAHVAIDYVTSRKTGKLYAKGDMHNFFVVIGFDQFLHTAFAIATFAWLVF